MLIVFFIFLSIGFYFILADIMKVPTLKKAKHIVALNKQEKKNKAKSLEVILMEYATKLSEHIRLDDYKRDKLEIILRSADIKMTPETYMSDVYIKTGMILVFAIPSLLISPILSIIFVAISVAVYFNEYNRASNILKKRKGKIEHELPRFAMTIEQELMTSRDVFRILENYYKNSTSNLGRELEITVADMRSGSYEEALRRFESRIGSSSLSEIVRGLLGVLNGNDETLYFRMLAKDLKELEYQRLRGIALKRPEKIKKYSGMMLSCIMLIYGVVLMYEIVNGLAGMF